MAYLYFDDSRHPNLGFSLGAFVITDEPPDGAVAGALRRQGLCPGRDEFKSGAHMASRPEQSAIRDELIRYIEARCSLAVVVVPASYDGNLGSEALTLLPYVLQVCDPQKLGSVAFFDEGLFCGEAAAALRSPNAANYGCDLMVEQDSRLCLGIQVADLVAHLCAMLLRARLGKLEKTSTYENPSTNEPFDAPIAWEIWYRLRRKFLPCSLSQEVEDGMMVTEPCGLRVGTGCSQDLSDVVRATFGKLFVGCVW